MRSLTPALPVSNITYTLTAVLLLVGTQLFAQSEPVLFFEDSRPQKLQSMDIGSDFIKYQKMDDRIGQFYNILKSDVMLAFYPLGTYHVYSNAQKDLVKVGYASAVNNKIDKLVKKNGSVITAEVLEVSMGNVKYKDLKSGNQASISTSNLAIILYKDGKYQMYDDVDGVAKSLLKASDIIMGMDNSIANGNFTVVNNNVNNNENVISDNVVIPASNNLLEEEGLPTVRKEEFEEKALAKTKELEDYLRLIANKNTKFQKANEAIDAAVKLFIDENRVMEVSSKNRTTVSKYKIRTYFEKLKLLKYDDVRVSWSDISYVSNIRKGEDGNYYGIVTLQQKFEGFIDNKLVYTDVTKKNMTVILKTYDKYVVGEKQTLWDVYLGDIGVVQTE